MTEPQFWDDPQPPTRPVGEPAPLPVPAQAMDPDPVPADQNPWFEDAEADTEDTQ